MNATDIAAAYMVAETEKALGAGGFARLQASRDAHTPDGMRRYLEAHADLHERHAAGDPYLVLKARGMRLVAEEADWAEVLRRMERHFLGDAG